MLYKIIYVLKKLIKLFLLLDFWSFLLISSLYYVIFTDKMPLKDVITKGKNAFNWWLKED